MLGTKIFLSGSRGYIASNLMSFLEAEDHEIVGFDVEEGNDVLDAPVVIEASRSCNAIIHLGAIVKIPYCEKYPHRAIRVNVLGTMNVCQAAKLHGIPVVFASTFAAKNPVNVYGLTKSIGERLILDAGGVVLRLANVYGGIGYLNKPSAMANFINKKKGGEKATIFGDGSATRDFIHVHDVCSAIIVGLDTKSGIYEVSTGRQTSILGLIQKIGMPYEFAERRLGDVKVVESDTDNFIKGWKPQISLEQGLKEVMR